MTMKSTTGTRSIVRALVSSVATLVLLFSLIVTWADRASALPGASAGNYIYFDPNPANPVDGRAYLYSSSALQVSFQAGSGSGIASQNSPCNKSWNSSDPGGRLPGPLWYNSPSPGWTATAAPYGIGLKLQDGLALGSTYGYVEDCANAYGSVWRTDLWWHTWNGNYVTLGCIKLSNADMGTFSNYYHWWGAGGWNGVDGTSYNQTTWVGQF
jgi:hypothetical protein